jgi:hypothetical protein
VHDARDKVGVDYHKRFSFMTVMDDKGKIVREGVVNNCKGDYR